MLTTAKFESIFDNISDASSVIVHFPDGDIFINSIGLFNIFF